MTPLLPSSTLGIIGGGQLGMMTVREAHRMGYRTAIWDPDPDCPAGRLADLVVTASFSDPSAAQKLVDSCDVVTYEFENIDPGTVEIVEKMKSVYPGSRILKVARHRKTEKETLQRAGFPVVPFSAVANEEELRRAVKRLGFPVVVKTVTAGYDGKGQKVLRNHEDVGTLCRSFEERFPECMVEKFLSLQCEVSVVAVRGTDGTVVTFPLIENEHRDNILHVSRIPARVSDERNAEAIRLGTAIIEHFEITGVLCVEMFITESDQLVVNELAPRPHNSGHFSVDACSMSQFEALVRAICNLSLHLPRLLSPCAMVNVLGKHLERIDLGRVQRIPGAKVHIYGKKRVEPRRKMGHITILGSTLREVEEAVGLIESMMGEDGARTESPVVSRTITVM
ncbi:MAG: 5-(carboxyamino)imidazole ribonucleotide synthase [Ignavibacteriales bacterium]|nr:5-(carboxyamino)imidazole ribonucleotide synthase [Ignavibacteriales bacterium]